MRASDIFVISPKGLRDAIPSDLLEPTAVQDIVTRSEYLAFKTIENLKREDLSQLGDLLPYVEMKNENCFTFKPSIWDDVFKGLYNSLLKTVNSMSFEDFCSKDSCELIQLSSPFTPIIVYWDDDSGLFMGVLEDFLRMPGAKDGEYEIQAIFSRHC